MCVCLCVFVYVCTVTNAVSATGRMLNNRTKVNAHQFSVLKAAFDINCYLSNATLMQLAQQTGLGKKTIRIWFRDRRFHTKHEGNDRAVSISEYYYLDVFMYQIITPFFYLPTASFPSLCLACFSASLTFFSMLSCIRLCLFGCRPASLPAHMNLPLFVHVPTYLSNYE